MHLLYVHESYPAQFGHVAEYLIRKEGFRCTFISQREPGPAGSTRQIQYKVRGGATEKNHFCSRVVEDCTWRGHAVYETLKGHREIRPDLIVESGAMPRLRGHVGRGFRHVNACRVWWFEPSSQANLRSREPPV